MARRGSWVVAGCLFLAAGAARGDALPYEPDEERGFDAKGVLVGLDAFPDHVFVQFPAACTREGDEDEEARLHQPAEFTVLAANQVFASPQLDSPNADTCSLYAIDRRGFAKDVVVALKSMTNKERRLFFETDPRAHVAGQPTSYQVVQRSAAEIGLKEELRPVMQKDGVELFPARRLWTLRGGRTRTELVDVPAAEPGPPPATPPAPAPPEPTPATPEPAKAPQPAKLPEPPPIAATPSAPPQATAPPPEFPNRSWLIMTGGFVVFAVLSGFFLLRRR